MSYVLLGESLFCPNPRVTLVQERLASDTLISTCLHLYVLDFQQVLELKDWLAVISCQPPQFHCYSNQAFLDTLDGPSSRCEQFCFSAKTKRLFSDFSRKS